MGIIQSLPSPLTPSIPTMENPTPRGTLPEELLTSILPSLPLKTLATFKCVSKPWKALIESPYFGRLFISLHKDLSTSWSLMVPNALLEAFGFHGCELWNMSKSPGSFLTPHPTNLPTFYRASSNGLVLIETGLDSLIGNPVLHNWFEIPKPPEPSKFTGLVTRLDEHGLVSSFKVVRSCESSDGNKWKVCVYSSELGSWTTKQLSSSHSIRNASDCDAMSLNGMVYLLVDGEPTSRDFLIGYDFYGGDDDVKCRVIPLPAADDEHFRRCIRVSGGAHLRRCLTSSQGYVYYIELVGPKLMKRRLKSDYTWERSYMGHIVSVEFIDQCFPLAMNPFDSEIIYFWSLKHGCFVSDNMWGQRFIVHEEAENWNWGSDKEGCCRVNTSECKGYMQSLFDAEKVIVLSQFVLPQWMESVPTIGQT